MGNDNIEAARTYHEITKHSYTSVRSGAYLLDWDNKPAPYKIYPDAGSMALPRELDLSAMPTLEAIAAPTNGTAVLDIDNLTRILFCANGLTRRARVGGEDYHFRAAASAGALYPIETYIAASDIEGIEAGLYHFSPADLKLRGLRRGDWRDVIARATAMRPSIANARAILIMSAIFWRSAWKYRARAYRYCFWDAGTILANLLAAAAAEGISAEVVTAFVDSEIETLIGVDADREGVICLVALGSTAKQLALSHELTALGPESIELSKEEVVYQSIVKMHRESRLESIEEMRRFANASLATDSLNPAGEPIHFNMIDPADAAVLGETILRRGSTRTFATEAIGGDELTTILSSSRAPIAIDFPRLTDTYLIVNAIEGLVPGAYYFERESKSFELLKAGDFRNQAGYLCLEQPLGRDCSALIVYMANLERALETLGNRGYRDAHLEAGFLAGKAYLASYAMDRGATGLTFYDDDTTRFFEPHGAGKSPLLMVAVGVPVSKVKTE
ncbi:MAG TPA: SagB/ThcOx family dehydrogenase [Candidatus Binataceae bacterium]|nr:SagB/ThcOx family dehydrogenase [Candidatus Binataceae bacterium]